jgi:short-subunit dehydrogenase
MVTQSVRKVVLVTGASAGIGAAVAREAAKEGYDLVLTARRADRLQTVANECRALGSGVLVVPADLSDAEAPAAILRETVDHFGGLDVLVNNAGFGLPSMFADSDPAELRRQLEVNFVAPLLLARHAAPYLVERGGTLINISSAITNVAVPALGAYGATKAGLVYFNTALRRELGGKGVHVCLVEPGPIKTDFFNEITPRKPNPGYNPLLDAPIGLVTAPVESSARRIVSLIRRPVRRLAVPRRFVWPWRFFCRLLELCPPVGDAAIASVVRFVERQPARPMAAKALTNGVKIDDCDADGSTRTLDSSIVVQ